MSDLPPCGIYKTRRALADAVPAGRLVFFHNHGDPGAGVYVPESWNLNRAVFAEKGVPVPSDSWARELEPLPAEGFYRVRESFHCCEGRCRSFETDLLVQLGYDGAATPLLFVPEWTAEGMVVPETGTAIDSERLAMLAPIKVAQDRSPAARDRH